MAELHDWYYVCPHCGNENAELDYQEDVREYGVLYRSGTNDDSTDSHDREFIGNFRVKCPSCDEWIVHFDWDNWRDRLAEEKKNEVLNDCEGGQDA